MEETLALCDQIGQEVPEEGIVVERACEGTDERRFVARFHAVDVERSSCHIASVRWIRCPQPKTTHWRNSVGTMRLRPRLAPTGNTATRNPGGSRAWIAAGRPCSSRTAVCARNWP